MAFNLHNLANVDRYSRQSLRHGDVKYGNFMS